MTSRPGPKELRLRPHHIMCEPFLVPEAFQRGEAFNTLAKRIKESLESQADTLIEVIEGTDWLDIGRPDDYEHANEHFAELAALLGI